VHVYMYILVILGIGVGDYGLLVWGGGKGVTGGEAAEVEGAG
jgi:hypothetical protein